MVVETIPKEVWVEIFRLCTPISLFNLRRTCWFFWNVIRSFCYSWKDGGFRVNDIPWGLQKGDPEKWVTDTYLLHSYKNGSVIYYQNNLRIVYTRIEDSEEFAVSTYLDNKLIYQEDNKLGVRVRTYNVDNLYQTDQYRMISGKLIVCSINKHNIKVYSVRTGLIFELDTENQTVKFREEIKTVGKAVEKIEKDILANIKRNHGMIRLSKIESILKRKPLSNYL